MKRYNVKAISVGKPMRLVTEKGEVETAFRKQKVETPIWLGMLNFDGDFQADQKHHGGPDKAVCLYPAKHYQHWDAFYQRTFPIPSFGENLTVDGIDERVIAIGDRFLLGEAELQVTQPRQPCYKIARSHQVDDFPAKVTDTGFTGFYLRVLKQGTVHSEDSMKLIEKDPSRVTIDDVNDVMYRDRSNVEKIKRILSVSALAASLRESLGERL